MSADVFQQLGEPEVSVKTRFLKLRIIPAPIVLRKISDPFTRHLSAEKPRHHRRVNNYAYAVLFAERKDFVLDFGTDERVRRLKRVNAVDRHRALQLFEIE